MAGGKTSGDYSEEGSHHPLPCCVSWDESLLSESHCPSLLTGVMLPSQEVGGCLGLCKFFKTVPTDLFGSQCVAEELTSSWEDLGEALGRQCGCQ